MLSSTEVQAFTNLHGAVEELTFEWKIFTLGTYVADLYQSTGPKTAIFLGAPANPSLLARRAVQTALDAMKARKERHRAESSGYMTEEADEDSS